MTVQTSQQSIRTDWGPGPIGDAVRSSFDQRLMQFIQDEESEAIQLFKEEMRAHSNSGDWYGEHAGKWLVTAGYAWRRTQSEELASRIASIAKYLQAHQEGDGYLGTYAADYTGRLTNDKALSVRTWDPWIHAWLILGLLEIAEVPGVTGVVETATKIGDLILGSFQKDRSLIDIGNHKGLSSAVMIQPLAELSLRTGNPAYAAFASQVIHQMEERGLPILSGANKGTDISEIGTGKAYQLCWILVGLATLYKATDNKELLDATKYWWSNIAEHHLTPMGGPWGGIATHKEVFNSRDFFSPYGLTETCSTASWMSLCRQLFLITGKDKYSEAFEKSLNNALLSAMDVNGRDWCYFTFPNGRRNNTYHWACCKSSGAMALEEAQSIAVTRSKAGISINLWHSFTTEFNLDGKAIKIRQDIGIDGQQSEIALETEGEQEFEISIRTPQNSTLQALEINGEPAQFTTRRIWKTGDRIQVKVAFEIKVHPKTHSIDHHGQEVVRTDYAYLSWGPYVYATGLIDGYKKEETLRLARLTPESPFSLSKSWTESGFPIIELIQPSRPPIPFLPYFEAGGRHDGAWRSTWMQVAWQ